MDKAVVKQVPIRTKNIKKYYRVIAEVGSGTYGRVYKAECLKSKQYVALKKFESKDDKIKEDGFPITAIREIKLLKQLDHPNIIKLREIIVSKPSERNDFRGSTFLVFDYMDHDFAGLHRNKLHFNLPELKCIMKQILLGVQYLHQKKIIHRDLKIANILYNNQGEVKIADFGLARLLNPQQPKYTNKVVTLWYRAPELLLGAREYTSQIDMWSVGCVFIELVVNENLLKGENESRQIEKIYDLCGSPDVKSWPEASKFQFWKDLKPRRTYERKLKDELLAKKKDLDNELINLIDGIMVLNPSKRFTVEQCLNHNFFKTEPLPLDTTSMPKIKEECHEALLKNSKNRHQVIMSQKNQFIKRQSFSPDRIPPVGQVNGGYYVGTSSFEKSKPAQNTNFQKPGNQFQNSNNNGGQGRMGQQNKQFNKNQNNNNNNYKKNNSYTNINNNSENNNQNNFNNGNINNNNNINNDQQQQSKAQQQNNQQEENNYRSNQQLTGLASLLKKKHSSDNSDYYQDSNNQNKSIKDEDFQYQNKQHEQQNNQYNSEFSKNNGDQSKYNDEQDKNNEEQENDFAKQLYGMYKKDNKRSPLNELEGKLEKKVKKA